MKIRSAVLVGLGFGVLGCSDMPTGQNLGPIESSRLTCLGDPDLPGDCTLWTCQTVPTEFAYKVHCTTKQPTSGPVEEPSYTCPDGSTTLGCPTGDGTGTGGGTWTCTATEFALNCDREEPTAPPSGDSAGCTLTQGFWKNHEEAWPVDKLEIGGVMYTKAELLALFKTAPAGDASLILAHQLFAAMLNQGGGAGVPSAVGTAFTNAHAWMSTHKDADGKLAFGVPSSSPAGQEATAIASTLDSYNNGRIGPRHCK